MIQTLEIIGFCILSIIFIGSIWAKDWHATFCTGLLIILVIFGYH